MPIMCREMRRSRCGSFHGYFVRICVCSLTSFLSFLSLGFVGRPVGRSFSRSNTPVRPTHWVKPKKSHMVSDPVSRQTEMRAYRVSVTQQERKSDRARLAFPLSTLFIE